jgi:secondary thiamine-phosphate synthase enzyme
MIRQETKSFAVDTTGPGLVEITRSIEAWAGKTGVRQGLLTLHVRHTSASLLIQENADPEVRSDLERFFRQLVPEGEALFRHTAEGPDEMPAHVRAALTTTSLSIPLLDGRLALGTWQGIYLWEHRKHPHRREIVAHILGE